MTRQDILTKIINNEKFIDSEYMVLADGFEDAFIGVTVTTPKKVIYDYWKCLDCIIKKEGLDFDDALDFLEEFVEEDLGENTPIYIKKI
jgi:hypothetical protein